MKIPLIIIFILFLFFLIGSGCITVQVPEGSTISLPGQGNTPNPTQTTAPPTAFSEVTTSASPTITGTPIGNSNEKISSGISPSPTTYGESSSSIIPPETTSIQPTQVSSGSQAQSTDIGEDTATQIASDDDSIQVNEESTPPEIVIVEISSEDVNRHFMNIAFGTKRNTIDRWTLDVPLQISVSDLYLPDDSITLQNFAKEFNKLSQSTKLSENIKYQTKGRLNFKLIPESSLKLIDLDDIQEISLDPDDDTIIYLISYRTTDNEIFTYFNKDLTGYERSHYMIRAMLFMLGFAGYTVDHPDSVFYVYSEINSKLSIFDKEAIKLMYGKNIKPGMTQDQVRRVLMMK